ncbi:hypothetical protein GCM10009784_27670 [Arthrobacter parietis]|uniref:Uncharacterized protein n=1 Tax=Arthrobacter parietis TaxID=271434 RepID=A0ABP5MUL7_9MICC
MNGSSGQSSGLPFTSVLSLRGMWHKRATPAKIALWDAMMHWGAWLLSRKPSHCSTLWPPTAVD